MASSHVAAASGDGATQTKDLVGFRMEKAQRSSVASSPARARHVVSGNTLWRWYLGAREEIKKTQHF
jgi:hypothetical protein